VAQHFTMSQELSAALDRWIAAQPDPKPSRPEAVRRLLTAALGVPPRAHRREEAAHVIQAQANRRRTA